MVFVTNPLVKIIEFDIKMLLVAINPGRGFFKFRSLKGSAGIENKNGDRK
jgi:hypothetical protein